MRTTINLDGQLLRRARRLAAKTRRTLSSVIEAALREALTQTGEEYSGEPLELPISDRAPGVLPGVDLDHAAHLLDLMERNDAPATPRRRRGALQGRRVGE